jgi:hypothetical protein
MLRGGLDVPEPLDENGQELAAARMEMEHGALKDARVLWNRDRQPAPKRERMSVTAADLAWARRILAAAGDR